MTDLNDRERLKELSGALKTAVILAENFKLSDVMNAPQLNNPKMDAYPDCCKTRKVFVTLQDAVEHGTAKIENFETDELLGIMDELMTCFIMWTEGDSLTKSIYTCLYMQNPELIKTPALKTFCVSLARVISISRALVSAYSSEFGEEILETSPSISYEVKITRTYVQEVFEEFSKEFVEKYKDRMQQVDFGLKNRVEVIYYLCLMLDHMREYDPRITNFGDILNQSIKCTSVWASTVSLARPSSCAFDDEHGIPYTGFDRCSGYRHFSNYLHRKQVFLTHEQAMEKFKIIMMEFLNVSYAASCCSPLDQVNHGLNIVSSELPIFSLIYYELLNETMSEYYESINKVNHTMLKLSIPDYQYICLPIVPELYFHQPTDKKLIKPATLFFHSLYEAARTFGTSIRIPRHKSRNLTKTFVQDIKKSFHHAKKFQEMIFEQKNLEKSQLLREPAFVKALTTGYVRYIACIYFVQYFLNHMKTQVIHAWETIHVFAFMEHMIKQGYLQTLSAYIDPVLSVNNKKKVTTKSKPDRTLEKVTLSSLPSEVMLRDSIYFFHFCRLYYHGLFMFTMFLQKVGVIRYPESKYFDLQYVLKMRFSCFYHTEIPIFSEVSVSKIHSLVSSRLRSHSKHELMDQAKDLLEQSLAKLEATNFVSRQFKAQTYAKVVKTTIVSLNVANSMFCPPGIEDNCDSASYKKMDLKIDFSVNDHIPALKLVKI